MCQERALETPTNDGLASDDTLTAGAILLALALGISLAVRPRGRGASLRSRESAPRPQPGVPAPESPEALVGRTNH
jgi:hypothetical protein